MARDVVDLIVADHRELQRIFGMLSAGDGDRQMLFQLAAAMLAAHSRAEEAEVYPEIAVAAEVAQAEHSREEHAEADALVSQMMSRDPQSREFERLMQQWIEAVEHHIQYEESTTLPALREAVGSRRLAQLADAFATRRGTELMHGPSMHQTSDSVLNREQLYEKARAYDIPGRSHMTKQELEQALVEAGA